MYTCAACIKLYNYKNLTPLHMMALRKRLVEEFDEVTHANPSKCAKLHGVLSSISPMKTSTSGATKYFDGELTDGQTSLRIVGFDNKQQQKLAEFQHERQPVSLVNCEVKHSKWGSQLEIVMGKNTQILKCPNKFDVAVPTCPKVDNISLDELQDKINYQRVNVMIKVLAEKEVVEINGLSKQDYMIGDATGTAILTTWEGNTGMFNVGRSYKLSGVMVRNFDGRNYLSMPRENCEVSVIDDIEHVKEIDEAVDAHNLKNATVIGVMSLETYSSCMGCKGKLQVASSNIGLCGKCGMTQRLDRCKVEATAKLMIEAAQRTYTLTAFTPILEKICQSNTITEEVILGAEQFELTYSDKNVITHYNN